MKAFKVGVFSSVPGAVSAGGVSLADRGEGMHTNNRETEVESMSASRQSCRSTFYRCFVCLLRQQTM